MKDIYIKGKVDPLGIHANPDALEETKRLQNIFDQRIQSLNEKKENFWRISYLNVRSLKGKVMDPPPNFITSLTAQGTTSNFSLFSLTFSLLEYQ